MDGISQLKDDLLTGRIDPNRLVDLMLSALRDLQAAKQRIAELEKQLADSSTAKVDEPFSMRAEEKRQERRGKKKQKVRRQGRRGRVTTADKIAQAERSEDIVPNGVAKCDCELSHTRPVWRLEYGRAVSVAYHIYRGPKSCYGKIPGVLGRSEFGMEIVVTIAYLIYIAGLSFDKACLMLNFFQHLKLTKSQADALLHQLSCHWQNEFEILCTLLANSAVVHADETSWSLNSV
ncbi:MAG TPA: hypothetical protein VG122_01485 [Gemmata sp.]|nr:hypothetical protein [Gemmata sp.]